MSGHPVFRPHWPGVTPVISCGQIMHKLLPAQTTRATGQNKMRMIDQIVSPTSEQFSGCWNASECLCSVEAERGVRDGDVPDKRMVPSSLTTRPLIGHQAPTLASDWLELAPPDTSSLINEARVRGVHCQLGLSQMKKYSHRYIISAQMVISIFWNHS